MEGEDPCTDDWIGQVGYERKAEGRYDCGVVEEDGRNGWDGKGLYIQGRDTSEDVEAIKEFEHYDEWISTTVILPQYFHWNMTAWAPRCLKVPFRFRLKALDAYKSPFPTTTRCRAS